MLDKADEYIDPRDREKENAIVIGANIRRIRVARRMSQMDLALSFGVSHKQFQKIEKGENRIGACRLIEMAKLMDCSISDFFIGIDEPGRTVLPTGNALIRDTMADRAAEAYGNIACGKQRQLILDLMRTLAMDQRND